MNFKKSFRTIIYWAAVSPLLFFSACGGSGNQPQPVEIDPNKVRSLIGFYEGLLVTTLEDFQDQQIGLSRVNDSVVSVVAIGETKVRTNFQIFALEDLSIIEDSVVVLSIPYQIVGSDTIQGAPIGTEVHGTYDKQKKELNFGIQVNYFNEEFQRPETSIEFYTATKTN